jgi:hypothetical protein
MFDRLYSYFCCSKHPGGGISVSCLDHFSVKIIDAFWSSGCRRCGRLVVENAETKERATRAKQKKKIESKKKYVYAIRLNFRQMVLFPRDPALKALAITWQTESVGFRRLALIREDVMNVIDVFIEAYLSENH